jgi:hypothetical protein
LGADFYDGNGDGVYNPTDLNGNGSWDVDEDRPDLLGDVTAWTVYNDGQPLAQRTRFAGVRPQGINVKQTVFGFASKGAIGNILFLRYRLVNTGVLADTLKNVYFGAWADPDLGDHLDDLVGVDTTRNAGFTYQTDPDAQYGQTPPCFMIDFFTGPIAYIAGETYEDTNDNGQYDDGVDVPLDTAKSVRGDVMGLQEFPGAKNLGVSSFVHYQQSDPDLGDPNTHIEARNYMLGLDKKGRELDPCDWALGNNPPGCENIDNRYWYSGDPVTGTGWLNTAATDQRQMQNTGPFELIKDQEIEIVVAYVVGQGNNPISAITEARRIDDGAQFVFDRNFQAPTPGPAIVPTVESGQGFIDLIWKTADQVNYINKKDLYDLRFEGFNVYAYRTNTTQDFVDLRQNSALIKQYDLDNFIENLEYETNTGFESAFPSTDNKLDPTVYASPDSGIIRLRITEDPFDGSRLIKGKPYYFAITGVYVNYDALVYKNAPADPDSFGVRGDYYLSQQSFVGISENLPKITEAVMSITEYDPPAPPLAASKTSGFSRGNVEVDVYDKDQLTGDDYEVNFFIDSTAATYKTFWSLTNKTTNTILLDSMSRYLYGGEEIAIPDMQTEGFILRVQNVVPAISPNFIYESEGQSYTVGEIFTGSPWFNQDFTAKYFPSTNLAQPESQLSIPTDLKIGNANYFNVSNLRRVELRMGDPGKAYRYLNGFIQTGIFPATKLVSYRYAENITSADTIGNGPVGMWDTANDRAIGFVDVPFTAWVEDFVTGETRQLAVGIVEISSKRTDGKKGNPDGIWDPDTSLKLTNEYIIIFSSDYDPNGGHSIYKGGPYVSQDAPWASLKGYDLSGESQLSADDIRKAKSPYFDAMYVVGIQKSSPTATYKEGDKFILNVASYPYTPEDVFEFSTAEGVVFAGETEKDLWEKVNVFPNPLFGYNVATSYTNSPADEPFVTFSNLPEEVTIKIYSLSGLLIRSLSTDDKSSPTSPFLRWDLLNESGLRVASGLYRAIVSSPKYGEKVLKFSIIMPQKQIQKF